MAKAILLCGKICSGKSFYAQRLREELSAVVLSCDELMLSLFPEGLGEAHDETVAKLKLYLLNKSVEFLRAGANVILDFGFWSKRERDWVSEFYKENGVRTEWHYVDVSDDAWRRNIRERNARVLAEESKEYFVDEGLLEKLEALFEAPEKEEMDCWVVNAGASL